MQTLDKIKLRGKEWSYKIIGSGVPCIVTGISPLYTKLATSKLIEKIQFIYVPLYWENEHSDFDVAKLTRKDIIADIDAVRQQLGYEKIATLNHSALGFISFEYALNYPQHNLFNIVIGTPPCWTKEYAAARDTFFQQDASAERKAILQANLAKFAKQKENLSSNKIYAIEYAAKSPIFWFDPNYDCTSMWDEINVNGAMINHYFNSDSAFAKYDNRTEYQKLNVPTLLALGRYDYAVPYNSWDFAKAIKKLRIYLFDRSAHYPMLEEQQIFDQVVGAWIDGLK